jgi:predicted amidohydrolase
MNNLNVTLVQANQIWEDKNANFSNYQKLIAKVSKTDLILLPEMFNTGFSMNVNNLAENFNNSISINWLKEISEEKNAAIYTSLIIEENGFYYNRGVFVVPNGKIFTYDKQKTFSLAGEDKFFTSGKNKTIVNYKNWNICLQICYDLRFPEISLNKITNSKIDFDLLIYVASWPQKRIEHWKALLPARAIENQCYVAAVNRVGTDNTNTEFSGNSCIIDLHGKKIIEIIDCEQIINFELSYSDLQKQRRLLPFLKDRKL